MVLDFKEYFTIREDRLITSSTDLLCVSLPSGEKKPTPTPSNEKLISYKWKSSKQLW